MSCPSCVFRLMAIFAADSIQQKTKLISVAGGTINLGDAACFTVPAGALATPTEIQVTLHHRNKGLVFRFRPHGTAFTYPAQLVLRQAIHHSELTVYYQARPLSQWRLASFVSWTRIHDTFHIQIPHFSSYYFIRRQGQLIPQHNPDADQNQPNSHAKASEDNADSAAPSRAVENCEGALPTAPKPTNSSK